MLIRHEFISLDKTLSPIDTTLTENGSANKMILNIRDGRVINILMGEDYIVEDEE